jgi:hypothetical protein
MEIDPESLYSNWIKPTENDAYPAASYFVYVHMLHPWDAALRR